MVKAFALLAVGVSASADTCSLFAIDGATCGQSDLNCDYVKYAKAAEKSLKDGTCADQGFTVKGDTETKSYPVIGDIVITKYTKPTLMADTCSLFAIDGATCGQSDLNCDYVKYAKAAEKSLKDGTCSDQGFTVKGDTETKSYPVIGDIVITKYTKPTGDFDAWMNTHGKAYNGDDEYAARKAIYNQNMKYIEEENQKGNTYTLGEGPFSDLTNEEFKKMYVSGFQSPSQLFEGLPYLGEHEESGEQVAADVNWVTKGAVTPVKNQGQCGSCWAFSTTGGLEGAWQIGAGSLTSMSEQQFVDCDKSSMGCNGGSMATAFSWAKSENVCTEQSYPYTAKDGSCKSSCSTAIPSGGVTGYKSVGSLFSKATKAKMQDAIQQQPVSIAIEADQASFQHYTSGILSQACGTNLDHGVLAVGYGEGYWLVKNSWGASWGEKGYIRLTDSGNECGILNQPVYPTVSGSVSV